MEPENGRLRLCPALNFLDSYMFLSHNETAVNEQKIFAADPKRGGDFIENLREFYHVNEDVNHLIPQIRNFLLDMDGTVYFDEIWIDGAMDFLDRVTETGRRYCFMTNNSSKNAETYVDKLHRMGLDIDPETQLITSAHATIDYLKRHFPGKKVYLFANKVLCDEFEQAGIELVEDNPDILVSAFDTSFNYDKLCKFCDFVREGLPFIATHPDYNCPVNGGYVPDIGSFHAYVNASTGRMPDVVVGKPNREIIDYTLNILGAKPENTAVVGDRLYTDIKSGANSGVHSIFVLSGEAQLTDLADSDVQPDLIFDSVKDIIPLL